MGHGTRDAVGVAEFMALARQVAEALPNMPVEPCFLELAEPEIDQGFTRLAERGARQITVMPVLLFAAGHAKHDIPQAVARAAEKHPGVTWTCARHLGCHPELLKLSAERFATALRAAGEEEIGPAASAGTTTLLLVGRGSNDQEATEEMLEFADMRDRLDPRIRVVTCFAAMARPLLDETLGKVSNSPAGTIVVQPHLLFDGLLVSGIRQKVEAAAERDPTQRYLVAGHLGPDARVAAAVLDRIQQSRATDDLPSTPAASSSVKP